MKYRYITRLFSIMAMALSLVFFVACDDDEETNRQVQLLSFGPSGVHHGDEIIFIGENLDKVTSIVLKPNVEVTSFTEKTATRIKLIVPQEAEAGKVILKHSGGEIESKTILNFEVPVTITSISGEGKPGTNITITGENINWIETITFPEEIVVAKEQFVSQSSTELVVTVPLEAQTGFLIFATGGTKPLTFGSEEALTVTLPEITSLTPAAVRHTEEVTVTGTNLDLVTSIVFTGDAEVSEFVSQSETEIKLIVPATAKKGKLTLKQASPVTVTSGPDLTIILPAGTSVSPTPAVPGQDAITITGTDLELVKTIILPGAGVIEATAFTSHTATEIKLAVPETATQGAIEYVTIHGYQGPLGVVLKLPSSGGVPTLDYYIYKDGLQNGWQAYGGWGHESQSYTDEENPLSGSMAIKTVFNNQWGAIQINNTSGPGVFEGYNYLVFYVYVQGEDSDIIVQIGENADFYPAHFTKDKYHQIVVPLADLAGADNVNELRIKNNNPVDDQNTVVFVDEIGLMIDLPLGLLPELTLAIYDDAAQNGFGEWEGFGAVTVWGDEAQFRGGEKSIKVDYPEDTWKGGAQMGGGDLPTAGTSSFVFSVYGGNGTDGKTLQLLIKSAEGEATKQVTISEGKWTDFKVPLSELNDPSNITELFFQNADFGGTIWIDHIGLQ